MGEQLKDSKPHKEKKNWKALLLGVGAFLLYKGFGLTKFLIKPLLKFLGLGHVTGLHEIDILSILQLNLLIDSLFLLAFIPFTRYFKGLHLIHIATRKFHYMALILGWLSVCFSIALDSYFDTSWDWWNYVLSFFSVLIIAILLLLLELVLLHFYGRFWRVIAQKKRTI